MRALPVSLKATWNMRQYSWQPREDAFLRRYYFAMGAKWCAVHLRRSIASVRSYVYAQSKVQGDVPAGSFAEALRERKAREEAALYPSVPDAAAFGKGIPTKTVWQGGVPKAWGKTKTYGCIWTAAEDEALFLRYPHEGASEQLADDIGRSRNAIRTRAHLRGVRMTDVAISDLRKRLAIKNGKKTNTRKGNIPPFNDEVRKAKTQRAWWRYVNDR